MIIRFKIGKTAPGNTVKLFWASGCQLVIYILLLFVFCNNSFSQIVLKPIESLDFSEKHFQLAMAEAKPGPQKVTYTSSLERSKKSEDADSLAEEHLNIHPFILSLIVPGLGQYANGQISSYFYMTSFAGITGWYLYELIENRRRLQKYADAESLFENTPSEENYIIVQNTYKKAKHNYKNGKNVFYLLVGIYMINAADALLRSPNNTFMYKENITPYIGSSGANKSEIDLRLGLQIKW